MKSSTLKRIFSVLTLIALTSNLVACAPKNYAVEKAPVAATAATKPEKITGLFDKNRRWIN